jgi:hypothetical protein
VTNGGVGIAGEDMHVSQIYLSDSEDQTLSPFLNFATHTVMRAFPGANHRIYDKQTLRQFLVDNYDGEVVWAYDKLRPYAYKSDLARFCLLGKLGGWYLDISIRIANRVELGEQIRFLGFRDIQRHSASSWACNTAIVFSKPGNKVFETAISYVIRNCHEEYYGRTPLCPTGPTVFGAALAAHRAQENYLFGDLLELTPTHKIRNNAFVMPDGTIMAWSKPAEGGDLVALGASGVNNYNDHWNAREVYAREK